MELKNIHSEWRRQRNKWLGRQKVVQVRVWRQPRNYQCP